MTSKITCRSMGHELYWDSIIELWRYSDTNEIYKPNDTRACIKCNLKEVDSCDPCLGRLPGVKNACCGHGFKEDAYIQFENGKVVRGSDND